jgi:hypothetical protein
LGGRIIMSQRVSVIVLLAVVSLTAAGCGHCPAPIRSARDMDRTSSSENMIVIVSLPLEEWPKLQKFTGLEHFNIAKEMASQITDDHIMTFSRLKLARLRQVSLVHCSKLTDGGLQALTNLPTVQGFQLIGTRITDRGVQILATGFPNLSGINVEGCGLLSEAGFLALTNSRTITDVSLSLDPFTQAQVENIISTVSNVTWWTISDPRHRLNEAPLRELGESRKITIQVADENNLVKGITTAQPDGAANGSQPIRSQTNQTSSAAGSRR